MRRQISDLAATALVAAAAEPASAFAGMDEAQALDRQRVPALRRSRKDEQLKEMEWFVNAAKPFAGMEINVVSETITTHEYEVEDARQGLHRDHRHQGHHDLIQEGDVVEKIQTQMQSGREHLRRLGQRLRPDRHALPLPAGGQPDRLDGGRGQGRHHADPRRQRLHRHSRSRPRRTASSTSCPTSSSRTSTGSATTGSTPRPQGRRSRPSTATTSACR